MKRKIFSLLCICIFFVSCNSRNTSQKQTDVQKEDTINVNSSDNEIVISDSTDNMIIHEDNNKVETNVILEQKQITELYAVNSFEGLRVRNTPSLNAEKIGLLEYQETVNVLSIDNEDVIIDGIKSKWYKIKSEKCEGYVFGGYLTPICRFSQFIENRNNNIDSDRINSMIDENTGLSVNWDLEDGIYLPRTLLIQSPMTHFINSRINGYSLGIVVRNGKITYFSFFDSSDIRIFNPDYYHPLSESFIQPKLSEDLKSEGYVLTHGDRSGGGEIESVVFDGKNLQLVICGDNCGFFEQATYILSKDSSEFEVNYDIMFPYFANLSEAEAYSSLKNLEKPDIRIYGNQRDIREELGGWGPLSSEGKENIIELVNCLYINEELFYEGIYRGNQAYLHSRSFRRIYPSKKALDTSISFEFGL